MTCCNYESHLVDVELGLASAHLSVAGAELSNEVVAVKTNVQDQ